MGEVSSVRKFTDAGYPTGPSAAAPVTSYQGKQPTPLPAGSTSSTLASKAKTAAEKQSDASHAQSKIANQHRRNRKQIETVAETLVKVPGMAAGIQMQELLLEVLLDIRRVLTTQEQLLNELIAQRDFDMELPLFAGEE